MVSAQQICPTRYTMLLCQVNGLNAARWMLIRPTMLSRGTLFGAITPKVDAP
jgi:hypothetical protein